MVETEGFNSYGQSASTKNLCLVEIELCLISYISPQVGTVEVEKLSF